MGFSKGIWDTLKGVQTRQKNPGADKQERESDNITHSLSQKPTSIHSIIGLQLRLAKSNPILKALSDLKTKKQDKKNITACEAAGHTVQETRPKSQTLGGNKHQVGDNTREREALYTWFAFDNSCDPIPDEYHPEKETGHTQEGEESAASSDGFNDLIDLIECFRRLKIESSAHQDTSGYTADSEPSKGRLRKRMRRKMRRRKRRKIPSPVKTSDSDTTVTPQQNTGIPSGPYAFLRDPLHPAPEISRLDHFGLNIDCADGCPDCEVWVSSVEASKAWAHAWFEEYFTPEDEQEANMNYPLTGHIPSTVDSSDEEYIDELYGGTDHGDYLRFERLYMQAEREHGEYATGTAVMRNMINGESEHWLYLPYHHGTRYNAILAEYEPRYIPHDGHWGYDANRPIWEARGFVGPGQEEDSWQQCMQIEYDRQWAMYHLQDDARRRYIAEVMSNATWQYMMYLSQWQQ